MITNLIYSLVSTPIPLSYRMSLHSLVIMVKYKYSVYKIYIYLPASTYIDITNEKLFPICFKRVSSVCNPIISTLPLSLFDPQSKNNT